jgi:hypothetical protein
MSIKWKTKGNAIAIALMALCPVSLAKYASI